MTMMEQKLFKTLKENLSTLQVGGVVKLRWNDIGDQKAFNQLLSQLRKKEILSFESSFSTVSIQATVKGINLLKTSSHF